MRVKKIKIYGALILGLIVFPSQLNWAQADRPVGDKPNIIFILADDLAWADAGYNGHPFFETPNLDKIVADGVNLNQMYSGGPNCMPTRACLITGMYTPRTHAYTPGGKSKGTKSYMRLAVPDTNELGSSQFPSERKGIVNPESTTSIADVMNEAGYATARMGKWHVGKDNLGFDISYMMGTPGSKGGFGNPNASELLTKGSIKFIKENKDKPFFLYLAHWDVHGPLATTDKRRQKYEEKNKKMGTNYDAEYAGMVEAFDESIKQIRETIESLGLSKNTIIIVSSDNGGAHYTSNLPLRGAKGGLAEGGIRVPSAVYWEGVTQKGGVSNIPITSVDLLPTIAELGGVDIPTSQPVDGASFVSVINGSDTSDLKERSIFWHYPLYLAGDNPTESIYPVYGTNNMYFRGVPSSAIRKGEWKLIYYYETKDVELFNIIEDPYEKNNLASTNTAKAEVLKQELQQWLDDTNAPQPYVLNPDFDASAPDVYNEKKDKKANKNKKDKKKKKKKKKKQQS